MFAVLWLAVGIRALGTSFVLAGPAAILIGFVTALLLGLIRRVADGC